jgi:ABC-type antimicrobial peptide transport system permease subunit
MVMRDSLMFAVVGIAIGIPVALGLSRAITSILYETRRSMWEFWAQRPVLHLGSVRRPLLCQRGALPGSTL